MIRGLLRALGSVIHPLWLLIRWPLQLLISVLVLAATISGGFAVYQRYSGPEPPPPVPRNLSDAVDEVCREVPAAVPRPERALRPLLVLPLLEDRELLVTGKLRDRLAEQGWYQVVDKGRLDRFVDQLFEIAGMPAEPVADPATAIKLGRAAAAEVVLMGRVDQFEPLDEGVNVAVHVRMFEVASGELLFDEAFSNAKPEKAAQTITTGSDVSLRLSLVLGLVAFALVWPPITIPVMRRVLRMESNTATLLTVLLITAVPVAAAWPVVFGGGAGVLRTVGFLLIVLVVGFWCMAVMSWVADNEG